MAKNIVIKDFSKVVTVSSTGLGTQLITTVSGGKEIIQKTITGSNIEVSSNGQLILLSAQNQVPNFTVSNVGTGLGVAKLVSGNRDFVFRSISGTGATIITSSENTIFIYTPPIPTFTTSNLGGGLPIAIGVSSNRDFLFRSLTSESNIIDLSLSGFTIKISSSPFTVSNLGGSQPIALGVSANKDFRFRTIGGAGIIDVRTSGNRIVVSAPNLTPTFTISNLGTGAQLGVSVSANRDFRFRTLDSSGGVKLSAAPNTVDIGIDPANLVGRIFNVSFARATNAAGNVWLSWGPGNTVRTSNVWFVAPVDCRIFGVAFSNINVGISCNIRVIRLKPTATPTTSARRIFLLNVVNSRSAIQTVQFSSAITVSAGDMIGVYHQTVAGTISQPAVTLWFISTGSVTNFTSSYNTTGALPINPPAATV